MRFTLEIFDVYLTFYIFAKTWNSKMHCFPIVLSLSETLIIHSYVITARKLVLQWFFNYIN